MKNLCTWVDSCVNGIYKRILDVLHIYKTKVAFSRKLLPIVCVQT